MPVSRITFALSDLRNEIVGLAGKDREPVIDIHLDADTHAKVVGEIEYRHGAKLQRDTNYRLPGTAVRYLNMRLISILPGNRVS